MLVHFMLHLFLTIDPHVLFAGDTIIKLYKPDSDHALVYFAISS